MCGMVMCKVDHFKIDEEQTKVEPLFQYWNYAKQKELQKALESKLPLQYLIPIFLCHHS
jgi:hypothetical protein